MRRPLTLWFDNKCSDTTLTKILDLSCFRFWRKYSSFFNITSMGKKLISKNHLNPALTSFSFEVSLKNQQKSGNDFRKVSVVQDLEHDVIHDSSFQRKRIIKEWDRVKTKDFKFFYISTHLGPDFSWFLCQQQKLRAFGLSFWWLEKQIFVVNTKIK